MEINLFGYKLSNKKDKNKNIGYSLPSLFERYGDDLENARTFYPQYEKSLYVYACVKKIAQKVSAVDYTLLKVVNSNGDTKEVKSHPILDLLYSPNPNQTKKEFVDQWIHNKELTGENFIWKVRNGSNIPVEMYNLRPDKMTIVYDKENNIVGYEFKVSNTSVTTFVPEDIIHDKNTNPSNPARGYSPIKSASARVQTEEYATAFQRDFFKRNARPDAILKVKDYVREDTKEDIIDKWENKYMGTGKGSKLAILEAGLEYQQVAVSQREMDYIESLKATRDDILVAFQVPKPIVAITDQVNYANAKTATEIFLRDTILPEVLNIIEVLNERMVYTDFDVRLQLDYVDFIAEDRELVLKEYEKGLTLNYLTINEVRMKEGLEPIVGGWSIYMPMGMTPVGGIPQNKDLGGKVIELDAKAIKQIEDNFRNPKTKKVRVNKEARILFEEIENLTTKMAGDIKKAIKAKAQAQAVELRRLFEDKDARQAYYDAVNKKLDDKSKPFAEVIKDFMDKQETRVLEAFKEKKSITKDLGGIIDKKKEAKLFSEISLPFLDEYFKQAGTEALASLAPAEDFNMSQAIKNSIAKRATFLGNSVMDTTIDKIANIISQGLDEGKGTAEIASNIRNVYAEIPAWRAEMIARTEATNANNDGLIEGYKQSGIATHKEWVATLDDRTRDEHIALNGEVVQVDQSFSNGLQSPSEINCRCVIAPVLKIE